MYSRTARFGYQSKRRIWRIALHEFGEDCEDRKVTEAVNQRTWAGQFSGAKSSSGASRGRLIAGSDARYVNLKGRKGILQFGDMNRVGDHLHQVDKAIGDKENS